MPKKEKILVVEDDPFNLDIIIRHLEEAGYETIAADDGDAALQKLAAHADIAVIVLDLEMPRLHGLTLLKELRKAPALKNIPVVVQTAVYNRNWKAAFDLEGISGYLTKPYDPEALVALVRAALAKGRTAE